MENFSHVVYYLFGSDTCEILILCKNIQIRNVDKFRSFALTFN